MATVNKRLFLTGASGLLGRAIYTKFVNEGWTVYGTAYSRYVANIISGIIYWEVYASYFTRHLSISAIRIDPEHILVFTL
jgi:NAD(P)-dependent dehydrogenase (short-subunit alcohol dehydrogenase family)